MANFIVEKSFTAGKTEATAETETVYVTEGTLKRVRIRFFKGAEETTYVKIMHKNRQVLPNNVDQAYRGDDEWIPIDCDLPIGNPATITLKGWNVDAENAHRVAVELEIDPGEKAPVKGDIFASWGWF